jgi:hydrogenase maturation protease
MLELGSTFSAYDACYVALAERLDAALLTADRRLARAVRTHTSVVTLPSATGDRIRVGRPLVIGYGNTLRRDDGVGVRAAELLAADARLAGADVLAVHQLTPELALDIGAASLVVFIDADVSAEPGAIRVEPLTVRAEPAPAEPGTSSHHVGAAELLALARELTGAAPEAVTVGIGVTDLEIGEGLSYAVEAALGRIVDMVSDLVASHQRDVREGSAWKVAEIASFGSEAAKQPLQVDQTVGLTPVRHARHDDDPVGVIDLIDDTVVADAHAPDPPGTGGRERPHAGWPRLAGERIDGAGDRPTAG